MQSTSAERGRSAVLFSYTAPFLTQVQTTLLPPMGPVGGGTLVLVSGQTTLGASDIRCRFGGAAFEVAGTASPPETANTIACATPESAAAGGVALTLSLNGQQWVGASSVFTYQQGAEVQSVIPDLSPNVGGLVLELTGANLAGGMIIDGLRPSWPQPAMDSKHEAPADAQSWLQPSRQL